MNEQGVRRIEKKMQEYVDNLTHTDCEACPRCGDDCDGKMPDGYPIANNKKHCPEF